MLNKRYLILFLILLLIPICVNAETNYVPQILKDFLKWLLVTVPAEANAHSPDAVIYFKLILWILVFPMMYFGVRKVFHDNNRVAGTVALILSLSSVLLIPEAVLFFIFSQLPLALFFGLIIWGLYLFDILRKKFFH
jgi:hypothetical protein